MNRNQVHRLALIAAALLITVPLGALAEATLSLRFEGMDPHLGQMLELRVVDLDSLEELERLSLPEIPMGSFDLEIAGLPEGGDLRLDFYADLSGNGRYDAPPVDHAWRLEVLDLAAEESLVFTHNTEFTDIAWPPAIDGLIGDAEYRNKLIDPGTGMSVFWQNDDELLYVGLIAPGTGWLSIGFEPENRMQGANILIASIADGELTIEDHYGNSPTSHRKDDVDDIIQAAGSEAAGESILEFVIPLDSGDLRDKALTAGSEVVIILAYHRSNDSLTSRHSERSTSSIVLDE